jgi:hypothetical protein
LWSCTLGYAERSGSCIRVCPTGQYSSAGSCYPCTNQPSHSYYTSDGDTSSTGCLWSCTLGYAERSGSCIRVCPTGQYSSEETCYPCTNQPSHSYYTSDGGTSSTGCLWSCNPGYTNSGGYCTLLACSAGLYNSGGICCACTNKPSGARYTSDGGASATGCAWSCDPGYDERNGSCTQSQPAATTRVEGGCAAGEYSGGGSHGCVACPPCPGGQYRKNCGGASQGACAACQFCPAGKLNSGCNGSSPGTCSIAPGAVSSCLALACAPPKACMICTGPAAASGGGPGGVAIQNGGGGSGSSGAYIAYCCDLPERDSDSAVTAQCRREAGCSAAAAVTRRTSSPVPSSALIAALLAAASNVLLAEARLQSQPAASIFSKAAHAIKVG